MNEFYEGLKSPGATPELLFDGRRKMSMQKWMNHETHEACPICDGHGGWWFSDSKNLWCGCSQCSYSGCVRKNSCIHEFGEPYKGGNCLHAYVCKKCGFKQEVDSGD